MTHSHFGPNPHEEKIVQIVIPGGLCVLHIQMRPDASLVDRAIAERIVTLMYAIGDTYAEQTA